MFVLALFVWACLRAAAGRVARAGQVEFALWLLGSKRAAPWWKNYPTVTAALLDATRPPAAQLLAAILAGLCAIVASFALWAALSWREFQAWLSLLLDSPAANWSLVAVPTLFVITGVYVVGRKSDRIAMSMARAKGAGLVVGWLVLDAALSIVVSLLGWLGFLTSLYASGRERELDHLLTRATMEISAGWATGLTLGVDRNGWPSWGVWAYAILLVAVLPWLHGLGALVLRRAIRHARSIIERVDALGLLDLEERPLESIAAVAAAVAAACYGLTIILI